MSPSILTLVALITNPLPGDVRSPSLVWSNAAPRRVIVQVYVEEIHCVTTIRNGRSRTVCRVTRRGPVTRRRVSSLPTPPEDPQPQPQAVVPVPAPPAPPPPAPTRSRTSIHTPLEQAVLSLLNQERRRRRMSVLRVDRLAVKAARLHSRDMCRRRFFSHTNPEGKQPWDRLKAVGARFRAAGENIAAGYRTAASVHHGWMTSPGHRKNRLNPIYRRAGVGIYNCGGTLYFTELFMK